MLNPNVLKARTLLGLGREGEALEAIDLAREHGPTGWLTYAVRAAVNTMLGNFDDAIAETNLVIESRPHHGAYRLLGTILYAAGRNKEAVEALDRTLEHEPDAKDVLYRRAAVHAILVNTELALKDLTRTIALHPPYRKQAATDDDFDALRDLPEFQELIKEPETSSEP